MHNRAGHILAKDDPRASSGGDPDVQRVMSCVFGTDRAFAVRVLPFGQ
jgi:hypothetical protein